MKNKYQEALDWVMEGNDSCGTEWDLLQELVDKEGGFEMTQQYSVYIIGDIVRGQFTPLENRTHKNIVTAKNRLEILRRTNKRYNNARIYFANNWEEVEDET